MLISQFPSVPGNYYPYGSDDNELSDSLEKETFQTLLLGLFESTGAPGRI